ncbi:MAG: NAD(P)H-binding protein [Acidimicrobiales bacterium]
MGGMSLVLGGNGKTGRRVVERLTARGLSIRIGSRSGVPRFDWDDQTTWGAALRDVEAAYVTYYPDLAVPGAAATIGAFSELAATKGVRRLVLLSGRGEEGARRAEQAVRESGVDWTILRSSWFSQNFSEDYLRDPVQSGEVALPVGDVPEPFIDADDIADIATAALTDQRHAGELYELTGPRLLTFAQAVAEIARAAGREVRFVPVSVEQYSSQLTGLGVPAEFVSLSVYLFTVVLDGRNAHLTDGVQRALGRTPRDFTDYAEAAAATGVWGGAGVPQSGAS